MKSTYLPQSFTYGQKPVRMICIEDKLWFSLSDVGRVLEMKDGTNFLRSEWCDEKGVVKFTTPTERGDQEMTFINERNLYAMVARSSKPEAKTFMDWVYGDLLPQIRKTGTYRSPLGIQDDPILASLGVITEIRLSQLRLEERVEEVDDRLTSLEHEREVMKEAVKALPAPIVEVRELSTREKCREAANTLSHLTGINHHDTWTRIYAKFDLVHRVCLTKRAGTRPKIEWIESHGYIDDLYAIITKMVDTAKQAA